MPSFVQRVQQLPALGIGISTEYGASAAAQALDVFAGRIYEGQPTRGLDEAMMVFRRLLKRERAYDDQTLFSVPIGSRYHPERAPLWNSELSTVEGTEAWIRDNG